MEDVSMIESRSVLLRIKKMLQTKVAGKTKTRILCSVNFPENRGGYEIMWKNILGSDRPQTSMQHEACELHA